MAPITKIYGEAAAQAFRDNIQVRDQSCGELYYTIMPLMGVDVTGVPIIERSCDLSRLNEFWIQAAGLGVGVRVVLQRTTKRNDSKTKEILDFYPDEDEADETPRIIRMSAGNLARGLGQTPDLELALLEQKHQYEVKINRLNQECEDLKRENLQLEKAAEAREKEWQAVFSQSDRLFSDKNARISELEELVELYRDIATKATNAENMLGLDLKETVQTVVRSTALGLAGYCQGMSPRQAVGMAMQGLAGFGIEEEEVKEAPVQRPQSTIRRKENE